MTTTTLSIRLTETQRADLGRVATDAGVGPASFARDAVVAAITGHRRTPRQRRRDRLAQGLAEMQAILCTLVTRYDLGRPLDLNGHPPPPGAERLAVSDIEALRREIHGLVDALLTLARSERDVRDQEGNGP